MIPLFFDTRAEVEAATIAPEVTTIFWLDGGVLLAAARSASNACVTSNSATVGWIPAGDALLPHFGGVGDEVSDTAAPLEAAWTWALATGRMVRVPGGRYRFARQANIYGTRTKTAVLVGDPGRTTIFVVDFTGADQFCLKLNGTAPAPTNARFNRMISNIVFEVSAARQDDLAHPGYLDAGATYNSAFEIICKPSRGVHFSAGLCSNMKLWIESERGGLAFPDLDPARDTSAIEFTGSKGDTTITAKTGAPFKATDVGRWISMVQGNTRSKHRIDAVDAGLAQVTVIEPLPINYTAANGRLSQTVISCAADTQVATTRDAVFTAAHVGAILWIPYGDNLRKMLRTRITAVTSSSAIEIDKAPDLDITDSSFGSPAVEIHGEWGENNDVRLSGFIVHHDGIGFACENVTEIKNPGTLKIHGDGDADHKAYPQAAAYFSWVSGIFSGSLASNFYGTERVFIANQNSRVLQMPGLVSTCAEGEVIFRVAPFNSTGAVVVSDVEWRGGDGILDTKVVDLNSPSRLIWQGFSGGAASERRTPMKGLEQLATATLHDSERECATRGTWHYWDHGTHYVLDLSLGDVIASGSMNPLDPVEIALPAGLFLEAGTRQEFGEIGVAGLAMPVGTTGFRLRRPGGATRLRITGYPSEQDLTWGQLLHGVSKIQGVTAQFRNIA